MVDKLSIMLRESVIRTTMSNLKIDRTEAVEYIEMPLDEQRKYAEKKSGRKIRFYQALRVSERTH